MNNKKIYFILLPAILVLFVLVAVIYFSGATKPKEIGKDLGKNTIVEDPDKVEVNSAKNNVGGKKSGKAGILKNAEEERNASICLDYEDEEYAVGCISLVAQKTRDLGACSLIKNQMEMVKCFDMTLFSKAADEGNVEFCKEMKEDEMSRSCVVNLVELGKIQKGDCGKFEKREKEYCDNYYSYLGDVAAAYSANNEGDCGNINNESAKAYCLDKFAVR